MTKIETIKFIAGHFNLTNRGTNVTPNGVKTDSCRYFITKGGPRCAIGILMTEEEAEKFERNIGGAICESSFPQLPKRLQSLGLEFLSELQQLHDQKSNWTNTGLSEWGQERVNKLLIKYK
jgi:hypothetical protein